MKEEKRKKPARRPKAPESSQQAIARMTREAGKLGLTYGQYVAILERGPKGG